MSRNNPLERRHDETITLASANETKTVSWSDIRTDGGTQMRVGMSQATIDEYTDAMRNGDQFPPIVVFVDENGVYWLADGFHRYQAQRQAFGASYVANCIVKPSGKRQAVLYAAQANAKHGLPRTPDDKRRAVDTLLADPEWANWTDREIARNCAVSHPFVAKRRAELSGNVSSETDGEANGGDQPLTGNVSTERTYTNRHGTESIIKTGNITRANQARKRSALAAPPSIVERVLADVDATHAVPFMRPLTLDETIALVWRVVKTAQLPTIGGYVPATFDRWRQYRDWLSRYTVMADYRHEAPEGTQLDRQVLADARNTIMAELANNIEHETPSVTTDARRSSTMMSTDEAIENLDVVSLMLTELGDVLVGKRDLLVKLYELVLESFDGEYGNITSHAPDPVAKIGLSAMIRHLKLVSFSNAGEL